MLKPILTLRIFKGEHLECCARPVQLVQAVEQSGDRFEQLERFELFERRDLYAGVSINDGGAYA